MKIKLVASLFCVALLSACSSTSQTTASHQTLEQRLMAKYASTDTAATPGAEPAPPAEGPDDVPADAPNDVLRNPALMPDPQLRANAAAGL